MASERAARVLRRAAVSVAALALYGSSAAFGSVKNVILMVSDGASFNTWRAATLYQGKTAQAYEGAGWVKMPMATYPLNNSTTPAPGFVNGGFDTEKVYGTGATYATIRENYTDSAAAATALATGVKTYNNAINWSNETSTAMKGIWEIAKERGFATGTISTVEWSHATPASFGAHNISRGNYSAIAHEMLTSGKLDVIMGAGNPDYNDNNTSRTPSGSNWQYVGGQTDWNALKAGTMQDNGVTWNLVETKAAFEDLADGTTLKKVVGTAQVATTLQQVRSGNRMGSLNQNVPTLATMAVGALNVLKNNVNDGATGMFAMIEGGAVDWAAHAGQAGRLMEEQVDFNLAVDAVMNWIDANSNWNETLLIVTADHGNNVPVGTLSANADTPFYKALNSAAIVPGATNATLEAEINFAKGAFTSNGDHTNEFVPLFAYGYGANEFYSLVDGLDTNYKKAYSLDSTWGTGYVNNTDVFTVMSMAIVPEPASLSLLALGALGLLARRRRSA